MKKISVAIDGPAAAGKSTVAKIIAKQLSYIYIDTGAMYRTLTYAAQLNELDLQDEIQVANLLHSSRIELVNKDDSQRVLLNGEDVTDVIRSREVTNKVSVVAKNRLVREEMVHRQQYLGSKGGVVMDGRDIGTHVLPNAEVKIFLLASVEERAKRRHMENMDKGFPSDLEELKTEIANRDKLDSEREVAPLKQAADAIALDTTALSIMQVVEKIMDIIHTKLA
ncbi:(d)CMP kinase [Ectobacillus sp. sgz5001026]|uniref:(d)CMP kinase n=1 Tax=Ectobacillus sp. sgz5001026 TaxID=3242473 RepID=UPI0036D33310